MFRSTTWLVIKPGFPALPYPAKPDPAKLGALFIAVIRLHGCETIIYRFRYPTSVSSLRKEYQDDAYTIRPSRWNQVRRMLFDASDERYIIKGIRQFPISNTAAVLHSGPVSYMEAQKAKIKVEKDTE